MSPAKKISPTLSIWDQKWFPRLVFGILAVVYLLNRSPFVGFNDGLSFLYSAETGFDGATNATSHLLYNNLQHLLLKVVYFLPPVLVLTLFSIACALCTLYVVYSTARLLTPARPGMAIFPVIVLGLAFTFWQQSEIIEVYAFNNLIFIVYLHLAIKDLQQNRRSNYLIVSLLVGIGLITHIQHILSLPFLMAYLWWRNPLTVTQKLLGMLPWMGLMSLLFILPQFTHSNDLRSIFFESQFQNDVLGIDAMALLKGLAIGIAMAAYCFHVWLWPMAMGWMRLWQQQRTLTWWLLLLLGPFVAFAVKYSVNDNHVFYLIPYLILVLPSGLALEKWLANGKRNWNGLAVAALLLPIMIYGGATLMAPQIAPLRAYDAAKSYKGGVVHLLWPGKAWAKDPLEIAAREAQDCQHDPANKIVEWNFKTAVRYLKWKCADRDGWTIYPLLSALPPDCFFDCPEIPKLLQNSEK